MASAMRRAIQAAAHTAANGRGAIGSTLSRGFDWAYGKAVHGMPGVEGAAALSARYAARNASVDKAVAELIAWQTGVAGVAGFVTGCGGFVALPAALSANIASALFIQARLIAAVAHLRGHDIASTEVRRLALACLTGSKAADTLKDAGVRFGTRLARDGVGWVSPALFRKLHHGSSASHAVLACGAGAGRFSRVVPVVGGVIAGGFDAAVTRMIGRTADRVFAKRAPGDLCQESAEPGDTHRAVEPLPDRP